MNKPSPLALFYTGLSLIFFVVFLAVIFTSRKSSSSVEKASSESISTNGLSPRGVLR